MSFTAELAGQLARPHGLAGRLLGHAMDLANRRPTRLALDLLDARAGETVLDVGCGTGAALAALLRRAPVAAAGIDPSPTMIGAARARLGRAAELSACDAASMPYAEGAFDAALMLNVLYFDDPAQRMVDRVRRALRPGGRLVAYVTHRETMAGWRFASQGRHRLYDAAELRGALMRGGFAAESVCVKEVAIARSVRGLLARAVR